MFKVKYTINLLPYFGMYIEQDGENKVKRNTDQEFIEGFNRADYRSLGMLETQCMKDLIDFKW